MIRNSHTTAGLLSLVMASGAAMAQNDKLEGSLAEPLHGGQASGSMTMVENNNGDEWTLVVSGSEVKVSHNGEEVPAEQVRRRKNKIEVLGKDGEVVKTFNVSPQSGMMFLGAPDAANRRYRALVTPRAPAAPAAPRAPMIADLTQIKPPKVMIGIRMSDDEGEVVVDEVIEGSPAEKAGLSAGDVLLSLGEHKIESTGDVRTSLEENNPGDVVVVRVRRDGKEQEIKVTLAEFDRTMIAPMAEMDPGDFIKGWSPADEDRWVEEAKKHVESAIEGIRKSDALNSEKMKATIEKAMREALAAIEKGRQETNGAFRRFSLGRGGDAWVYSPDKPNEVFTIPSPLAGEDIGQKLDAMSERLDAMSKRLEELQKRLEKNSGR